MLQLGTPAPDFDLPEPSGKRVKYEKTVPGVGPIDRDEIIKGYEISKDRYVLLEDEEIEAVRIESRKTLELVQFVDACVRSSKRNAAWINLDH